MTMNTVAGAFFGAVSLIACASLFSTVTRTIQTPMSLSDSVKLYERSRGATPIGMPGFYGASR